ncbi:hypothetical protein SO802_011359 [Lithocarpus litseifolius]|uniref:Ubiquitin-like protease family profile domain-containing protein n=1 Tax=Lithocarpus litseifolius TaxID=425828 RepID=A0AAW2CZS1_9ROSI
MAAKSYAASVTDVSQLRHWSLLIFCHFGESTKSETRTPCMLFLDSLEKANPGLLEPDIRKYVYQNLPPCVDLYWTFIKQRVGLRVKTLYQIPHLVAKVPQQRNGEECRSFVLYFINLFMESAPEDFSTQHFPYFVNSPCCLDVFMSMRHSSTAPRERERSKRQKPKPTCLFDKDIATLTPLPQQQLQSTGYKESELNMGENSCFDHCVSKYWHVTNLIGQLLGSGQPPM